MHYKMFILVASLACTYCVSEEVLFVGVEMEIVCY